MIGFEKQIFFGNINQVTKNWQLNPGLFSTDIRKTFLGLEFQALDRNFKIS